MMVLRVELEISQPANSTWKPRTSSAVAVSGEWPSQAANRLASREVVYEAVWQHWA
jgi:hypothetical protein